MKLTKEYILNRINRMLISFRVTWEDLVHELDMGIEEINKYLSTRYPLVSSILDEYSHPTKTYSYRAGGVDRPIFPNKYFFSVVIPYAAAQLLSIDEEFGEVYSKYENEWRENLFVMARDEINNIPYQYISKPQGVYFANPDPMFKENPEKFFNKQIKTREEYYKVEFSWGDYLRHLPNFVSAFVSSQLPKDFKRYRNNEELNINNLVNVNWNTFLVDTQTKNVVGILLGWSLENDNDPNKIIQNTVTFNGEDITLYAVFDFDVIGIKFNGNGGTLQNWKPMYVPLEQLQQGPVIPYGGTAIRRGYKFLGFDPDIVDPSYIKNITDPNDVHPEEDFEFKAKWEKETYKIVYKNIIGLNQVYDLTHSYTFREYIKLVDPLYLNHDGLDGDSDDWTNLEINNGFIGWWDNPQFQGSPVTEININEINDKVLYARYNREKVVVTWILQYLENGNILEHKYKDTSLFKGSFIKVPEFDTELNPELFNKIFKDNIDYNLKDYEFPNEEGLYYRHDFKGWLTSKNIKFVPNLIELNNNEELRPEFILNLEEPIMINLNIPELLEINSQEIHKGRTLNALDIVQMFELGNHTKPGNDQMYIDHFKIGDIKITESKGFKFLDNTNDLEIVYTDQKEEFTFKYFKTKSKHSIEEYISALDWKEEQPSPQDEWENIELNNPGKSEDEIITSIAWTNPNNESFEREEQSVSNVIVPYSDFKINKERLRSVYNDIIEGVFLIDEQTKETLHTQDITYSDGTIISTIVHPGPPLDNVVVPVLSTEFIPQPMMTMFSLPLVVLTYKEEYITAYFENDFYENKINIHLKTAFANYIEHNENKIHSGYKVNGIISEDILTVQKPKESIVLNVTPNMVDKQGFEINFNVIMEDYIPESISMELDYYTRGEIQDVLLEYEKEIKNRINNSININKTYSYNKEFDNITLISKEAFDLAFNEYSLFKGLELVSYEIYGTTSEDFPITFQLPKAETEITKIDIKLNVKLLTGLYYKKIYIKQGYEGNDLLLYTTANTNQTFGDALTILGIPFNSILDVYGNVITNEYVTSSKIIEVI